MPLELRCENCAQPFYCYPSEAEKGRKYCSKTCRANFRSRHDLPAASRTPVNFTCKECNKPFTMMQSYLTAYRKKFERDPMYCCMECSNRGRRKDTELKNRFTCVNCGKEHFRHRNECGRVYTAQKLCSKQCKAEWVSKLYRERHGTPEISRRLRNGGYVELRIPARDGAPPTIILEHRYNMEKFLGRPLHPKETVHHKNGERQDNRLENLELFAGNHGPGQRVIDKVAFAIDILRTYPEFARAAGVELRTIDHVTAS